MNKHTSRAWTDERVETLKRMHAEGFSSSQIAAELGAGFTRNMVTSKAVRLALPKHPKEATIQHSVLAAKLHAGKQRVAGKLNPAPTAPVLKVVAGGPVALIDLEHHHCRWPIGDPRSDAFGFCGKHRVGLEAADSREIKPYCADHCAVAYTGKPVRPAASSDFAHRRLRRAS